MRLANSIAVSLLLLVSACATTDAPRAAPMNDQRFAAIEVGMSADQVRAALGDPWKTEAFPLSKRLAWDYEGRDTWGYMVIYSVTFTEDQRVVSKLARRINDGGDMSGH
jgi:outer membrane protein assembly factor BamE (lipoprotein component of BamABCDE complex)